MIEATEEDIPHIIDIARAAYGPELTMPNKELRQIISCWIVQNNHKIFFTGDSFYVGSIPVFSFGDKRRLDITMASRKPSMSKMMEALESIMDWGRKEGAAYAILADSLRWQVDLGAISRRFNGHQVPVYVVEL